MNFEAYQVLIDGVRATIAGKLGAEVSADPEMIVQVMLPLLANEELLVEHVYEEASAATTDEDEWKLIVETFAWRLVARYNRELREELGEREEDDDDSA